MKKELSTTFLQIVSAIDTQINGYFVSNVFYTTNTKWALAYAGQILTDDFGAEYAVTEVSENQSITFKKVPSNLEITTLYLNEPFGIVGTQMSVNQEFTDKSAKLQTKLPLIWLLESTSYRDYGRDNSRLFDADIRVFFLNEYTTDQRNIDVRASVVKQMDLLSDYFMQIITQTPSFKQVSSVDRREYTSFSIEAENGYVKRIIDADLAGVELRFSLTVFKSTKNCLKTPSELIIDGGASRTNYTNQIDATFAL